MKAYEKGVRSSSEMDGWFAAFDISDPAAEPHFRSWMKRFPDSYAARLAYARYLQERGYQKRGTKFMGETSEEQVRGMTEDFKLMLKVLDDADSLTSKPLVSHALRLSAGNILGWDRKSMAQQLAAAEKVDPDNSFARIQYMRSLMPKWGGREGELESYLGQIRESRLPQDIKDVITFRGLLMQAEQILTVEKADAPTRERAARLYEQADAICSAFAPGGSEILASYMAKEDYQGALRYLHRHQGKEPDSAWVFRNRGYVLWKMGRKEEAFGEYKRGAEMGDASALYSLGWFYEMGTVVQQDSRRAVQLYETAAAMGNASARESAARLRKKLNY